MNFEEAWPLLKRAAVVGDLLTKEEAEDGIGSGALLLFTRDHSAALVARFPEMWRIGLAAGDMAELLDIEAEIDMQRRAEGVPKLQIVGRLGWHRALPDYSVKAAIMEKNE